MKTNEKPKTCANPSCGTPMLDGKTNKRFCSDKCKYTYNNAQARERHLREYKATEGQLRHNVAVLKKLLLHPKYQSGRIERYYLRYEGFFDDACRLPNDAQKAIYPEQDIAWSHNYGIEIVAVEEIDDDTQIEWITIHHNPKNQ